MMGYNGKDSRFFFLEKEIQELGYPIHSEQTELILQYVDFLLAKNQQVNLTGSTSFDELYHNQLRDCFELLPALSSLFPLTTKKHILDIGSGGGLPGIILSILKPDWEIVMVESITKKAKFLQECLPFLSLSHVVVKNARAEDLMKLDYQQKFDLVMARGVGKYDYLYPLFTFFVKPKGYMVFWKKKEEIDPSLKKRPLHLQKEHLFKIGPITRSILVYSK